MGHLLSYIQQWNNSPIDNPAEQVKLASDTLTKDFIYNS